jgi:hypothetical protein
VILNYAAQGLGVTNLLLKNRFLFAAKRKWKESVVYWMMLLKD